MTTSLTSSTALLIIGMHRSGTSALTRVVNLLGAELSTQLIPAGEDNERGFWEQQEIVMLHEALLLESGSHWDDIHPLDIAHLPTRLVDDITKLLESILTTHFADCPLWAVKDPRLSLCYPLWKPVLAAHQVTPICVLPMRHPLEVAASLATRDAMPQDEALALWLHYTLMAEYHARDHIRAVCSYPALLADWRTEMTQLGSRLKLDWPVAPDHAATDIEQFLSPDLRHHHPEQAIEGTSPLHGWVRDCYALLDDAWRRGEWHTEHWDRIRLEWQTVMGAGSHRYRTLQQGQRQHEQALADAGHAVADMTRQRDTLKEKYVLCEHRLQAMSAERDSYRDAKILLEQKLERLQHSPAYKAAKALRLAPEVATTAPTNISVTKD